VKKIKISEIEERELRQEVENLEAMINDINSSHGSLAAEEKGLFHNPAARIAAMDLERWIARKDEILNILARAEVVKIDTTSDNMEVEIGDIVNLDICYEGMSPRTINVQIAGEVSIPEVKRVTYDSALARAILGKKVEEKFESSNTDKLAKSFVGVVREITKAKDLTKEENQKVYMLKK